MDKIFLLHLDWAWNLFFYLKNHRFMKDYKNIPCTFSQTLSPILNPNSTSLFSCHFTNNTLSGIIKYLSFEINFISLRRIFWGSFKLWCVWIICSFILLNHILWYGGTSYDLWLIEGHLGTFYFGLLCI